MFIRDTTFLISFLPLCLLGFKQNTITINNSNFFEAKLDGFTFEVNWEDYVVAQQDFKQSVKVPARSSLNVSLILLRYYKIYYIFFVHLELGGSISWSIPWTLIGHMITLMFKKAVEFLCLCGFILRIGNINFVISSSTNLLSITSITSNINKSWACIAYSNSTCHTPSPCCHLTFIINTTTAKTALQQCKHNYEGSVGVAGQANWMETNKLNSDRYVTQIPAVLLTASHVWEKYFLLCSSLSQWKISLKQVTLFAWSLLILARV